MPDDGILIKLPDAIEYKELSQIRFLTATSLFDDHDASINIMRRILQSSGAEVIHLGQTTDALFEAGGKYRRNM